MNDQNVRAHGTTNVPESTLHLLETQIRQMDLPRQQDVREPPAFGHASRDAIASIVDGLATEVGKNIATLRKRIDQLEQVMLSNAARVKIDLGEHVVISGMVQDEILRLNEIVEHMHAGQIDSAQGQRR